MAQYGGGGSGGGGGGGGGVRLLYGVMIRDKIKTANLETLMAYSKVGHDLAKGNDGHDGDLQGALADLDKAIAAKKK
jgi:hypothetical protein